MATMFTVSGAEESADEKVKVLQVWHVNPDPAAEAADCALVERLEAACGPKIYEIMTRDQMIELAWKLWPETIV